MIMTLKPERMSPQSQRESFSYVIYIPVYMNIGFFFCTQNLFIYTYVYVHKTLKGRTGSIDRRTLIRDAGKPPKVAVCMSRWLSETIVNSRQTCIHASDSIGRPPHQATPLISICTDNREGRDYSSKLQ